MACPPATRSIYADVGMRTCHGMSLQGGLLWFGDFFGGYGFSCILDYLGWGGEGIDGDADASPQAGRYEAHQCGGYCQRQST